MYVKTGLFLLLLASSALIYSQNIVEINNLSTYDVVAGPNNGYSGTESAQWQLYNIISANYSSEIIETEYFKTESIISKIYLYWILRERNWHNLPIIYEDLMYYKKYKLWFSSGCTMYSEPIEIEHIVNFDYKTIQENTDEYNYDSKLNLINSYKIMEQLFIKRLSEYLILPRLEAE